MAERVPLVIVDGLPARLPAGDTLPAAAIPGGGGGGSPSSVLTATVPSARIEHYEMLALPGVTPSSRIMLSLASHGAADENEADMLDIQSMSATAGTDQIEIVIAFGEPQSGPIKILAQVT